MNFSESRELEVSPRTCLNPAKGIIHDRLMEKS